MSNILDTETELSYSSELWDCDVSKHTSDVGWECHVPEPAVTIQRHCTQDLSL
jgi:hypothetical protein